MYGMDSLSKRMEIRIRLTRPFLGDRRYEGGIRRFDTSKGRDGVMLFHPNVEQWRWAFREALDSIGLLDKVDVDYLRFPVSIKSPAIAQYVRRVNIKHKQEEQKFECFRTGTVLTIPVFLLGELEGEHPDWPVTSERPTEDLVLKCFAIIGEDIGLSPWGSKFGYGRFDLETDNK